MAKSDRPRDLANDIIGLVREGTKKWTKTRKAEERSPSARFYRASRMTRERGVSFKEAAAEIMEEAYNHVSGGGELPANARQIMYAARGHIQKVTGREIESKYFTQTLLPDYLEEHADLFWDVATTRAGISPSRTTMAKPVLESVLWKFETISPISMTLPSSGLASANRKSRLADPAGISARCSSLRRRGLRRSSERHRSPRNTTSPLCLRKA